MLAERVPVAVLRYAERNGRIVRPAGWLDGIRLPRVCGGRKVVRTQLEPEQTLAIIGHLGEPYGTLALFLTAARALAPVGAGLAYTAAGGYRPVFWGMAVVSLLGAGAMVGVSRSRRTMALVY